MGDQIVGTVARILSAREIVLNRGVKDGVKVGDYVGIIDREISDDSEASQVADPTTGEAIGQILHFKVSLRITQVSDSVAIASTYQVQRVNRGGYGRLGNLRSLGNMFEEPDWVEEVQTMKVNVEDLPSGDSESVVAVGDEFRIVPKDVADSGYML
jgi:hypothetical protein